MDQAAKARRNQVLRDSGLNTTVVLETHMTRSYRVPAVLETNMTGVP
jgi:hypothetical protein